MATDLERLTVSLEASTVKYERAMQKALGVTNTTMQRIERRNVAMTQRLGNGFSGLQRGIATAFAGAAALRGAQQLIDASTRIENSLKVAGLEGEQLARVYDDLFVSAQRNAAPIEALVDLYSRASLVQKELGVSTEELLNFTDKVAVALRVSGKSAQESSGALLQLSQALGSGVVRAEEFNSLLEGALPIAQAAAAGLEEAGGSVAKLRALVVDGKVSSEAFFRAFELGSVILTEKVANAELTVAQQFVRLQNVLIDTAGKFDEATGASARIGSGLEQLAEIIGLVGTAIEQNKESITWFIDALGTSAAGMPIFADILRGVEAIKTLGRASKEGGDQVKQSAEEIEAAILDTIAAMVGLDNAASFSPEQLSTYQALVDQMVAGEAGADELRSALAEMGATPVNFMVVIGALGGLIDKLRLARGEANATAAAVAAAASGQTAGSNIDGQRAEQIANRGAGQVAPSTISIKDPRYAVPPSSSGGGGGGKSGADRFAEALASQQQRIDALNRETELMRQLNPLVNDYGFAVERLKAQIELENAAKEAGLPLDETRMRQIDDLAAGYGRATAEAARLADAQDLARQAADDLANAGRQALDTIIDGFLEGKDAGEIFNSVLKDLAKNLLNIGLNSISGGMNAGGFNPLGFLGGLLGFASGTANTGGQRGQARGVVHGQEAVIPLPSGGKVPVDLRIPSLATPSAAPQQLMVHIVSDDEKFGAYVTDRAGQVVAQASPSLVASSVTQANKTAPASVAKYQRDVAGGDYRLD